jgi:hypothetical protein
VVVVLTTATIMTATMRSDRGGHHQKKKSPRVGYLFLTESTCPGLAVVV